MKKPVAHFINIGKTGGSALRYTMQPYISSGKFKIQFHGHNIHLRDIPKGEKVFFFLRDPVDRFISSFYSRYRKGRPCYNVMWNKNERIAFSRFATANDLAEALNHSNGTRRQHAYQAMKQIRHVNSSVFDWFESIEYLTFRKNDILFIGFTERLGSDFNRLRQLLDLPADICLIKDKIKAHKAPPRFDITLSPRGITNICDYYRKDMSFYLHCKMIA